MAVSTDGRESPVTHGLPCDIRLVGARGTSAAAAGSGIASNDAARANAADALHSRERSRPLFLPVVPGRRILMSPHEKIGPKRSDRKKMTETAKADSR
ncbi:hypothetical protein GCM10023193_14010 [Planotetraspora kaengkrachanensis]|uniref:Uncharacterized protein n=1 Tax=Planotetraspora kaengkrachanensis TaxID=575193 RepID=A0A8J3M667_9ACTN|nr:hypothetical protein Pka01_10520 [Planotetraspora kaengkrachanensis]